MRRPVALLLTLVVVTSVWPAVAAAQSNQFGDVVVAEGETVDGLSVVSGTVVVRGTVDGDLRGVAGNVHVTETGEVTGNVEVAAGNLRIDGAVGGDVSTGSGNVVLSESGTVGGTFEAGAGSATLAGTVDGDVRMGAGTITLAPSAVLRGDFEYDGELDRADGATVEGTVTRNDDINVGVGPMGGAGFAIPRYVTLAYGLVTSFVVGAVLLLAFPRFSSDLADRVSDRPLRSSGVGLLAVVVIPIALVLVAITIVGLPLSVAGFLAFGLLAWLGAVYGRYAIGAWLASLAGVDNRWVGLAVGVLAVGLATIVPIIGGLVEFLVFLLGFGALVLGLYRRYSGPVGGKATPTADVGGRNVA